MFEVVLETEEKAGRTLDAGSRKLSTLNDTKLDVAAIEGKGSLVNTIDEPLVHVTGGKKARQQVPCSLFVFAVMLCLRTRNKNRAKSFHVHIPCLIVSATTVKCCWCCLLLLLLLSWKWSSVT